MSNARTLVLTFDSMDEGLVRHWAEEGTLPAFARLLDGASWGHVSNPSGIVAGSVWSGFYSALTPGSLGLYNVFWRFDPESYLEEHVAGEDLPFTPFWVTLARQGLRVVLLDCPYNYLDETCGAIQVLDWGTHDRIYPEQPKIWPAEIEEKVLRRFSTDPLGYGLTTPCDRDQTRRQSKMVALRDGLLERCARRERMILSFVEDSSWDLLLANFSEAHCVGHACWHLHDERAPGADLQLAKKIGNPVRDVYQRIDEALDKILREVGDSARVFAYLSHGMGPGHSAADLLDAILAKLDGGAAVAGRSPVVRVARSLWRRAPLPLRRVLMPLRRGPWQRHYERSRHRADRRFFEIPSNHASGAVRINLDGREAQGKVSPAEYESVLEQLVRDLAEVENADSGEPLVERVGFPQREFPGPLANRLPDLVLDWNRSAPIRRVRSPKIGQLEHVHRGHRTGDHESGALFALLGGSGGERDEPFRLEDLAPTIAAGLGHELPGVEGRPIDGLIEPTYDVR